MTFFKSDDFTTIDQMKKAMIALYDLRASGCLEFDIEIDPYWYPQSDYAMCSADTQTQAAILTTYIIDNCCDERVEEYYPLLDNVVEWMDTEYGSE